MIPISRLSQRFCLSFAVLVGAVTFSYAQKVGDGNVRNSPADASTAIRFFFQPPGSYFHVPLILQVAEPKDRRLNTAPLLDAGRTAYISLSEMQQLLPKVTHLVLLWQQGDIVEVFGSASVLPLAHAMDVTIVSSHGTARAAIQPDDICKTLGAMDSALKTPRALWEFQFFRLQYGCRIPGFRRDAYPERYQASQ